MFKRLVIILAILALVGVAPAFAFMDAIYDDSNTNQQGQAQGQIAEGGDSNASANATGGNQGQQQGQGQGQIGINKNDNTNQQGQGQGQGQIGINKQGQIAEGGDSNQDQGQQQGQIGINKQMQGQIGINDQGQDQDQLQGQGQAQGNLGIQKGNTTDVNVQDNSEYNSYAFSPPAIHAQKGTSTANMYSIFGGVGLSQTEEYTIAIEKIAVIERLEDLGYITKEEAIEEARQTFKELDSASQPKRIFGIFGRTRGRHLLNGLGLFAWDSFYKEGQKPFSKSGAWSKKGKEKEKAIEDSLENYRGNEGNL
jgi:hypothetical protein